MQIMSESNNKYYLMKIQHDQDIRRVSVLQDEISFQGILRTIRSFFKDIPRGSWFNLSLKYTDIDGELCSITKDEVLFLFYFSVSSYLKELMESIRSHRPPLLKIFISFETSECVGQRALASQFPECSYPFTTVLSVRDKISPSDFNKARASMDSYLHQLKTGPKPHIHVKTW
jgi:hypothetical protein